MATLLTSELAQALLTMLGLAITAVAIARDVGPRRGLRLRIVPPQQA